MTMNIFVAIIEMAHHASVVSIHLEMPLPQSACGFHSFATCLVLHETISITSISYPRTEWINPRWLFDSFL